MTSEEMTTGSVSATDAERRWAAKRSRWWNSTGGGSSVKGAGGSQKGNVKAGDGGKKFRAEWPELDKENTAWMREKGIDLATGMAAAGEEERVCAGQMARRASGSEARAAIGAVVEGGQVAREAGQGWVRRNKLLIAGALVFGYVLLARMLGEGK